MPIAKLIPNPPLFFVEERDNARKVKMITATDELVL